MNHRPKRKDKLKKVLANIVIQSVVVAFIVNLCINYMVNSSFPSLFSILFAFIIIMFITYIIHDQIPYKSFFTVGLVGAIAYFSYLIILMFFKITESQIILINEVSNTIIFGAITGTVYIIMRKN